ncbi:predicted protein [Postia placenta Mad-698-R]|nr:predicted protein [Postia placenta Mad-698-R]
MPVKPTEKIIRTARKQAAQGPVVPPVRIQEKVDRAKGDKQKDKPPHMNESVERRSARIQGQPAPAISDPKPDREVRPVQPHTTRDSHERVWEHQQPVDTSQRNFDPANDDEIMEDDFEPIAQKQKLAKDAKKGNKTDATPGKVDGTKRVPKKSDVQAQVDQMKILGKVLSTPVTLAVGEVFGISKEMSQHLQNVLKPKSPVVNIVASSFSTKTRGLLIRLRIEIDGRPIIAIVDTGSQLNIAHKRIWKTMLNRPMDIARSVNMNDANGGAGILQGLVENVPLTCGGVLTYANLYIGDKVPFDLLLGRPWQRGNYISIDERSDGTYLLFKDKDLEVRHEILVTPDGLDPNWSFDPAVWHSIQNSTQKGLLGQKDTRVLYCGDFREDYIYNSAYERFWQKLGADLDEMEQQEQEEQTTSRESIQPADGYTVYQVQQQPTPALLCEDNLLNDRLYVHDHSHPNEEPLLICGIKIPEKGGDQIASPNSESAAYEEPLQHLEIQKQKRKVDNILRIQDVANLRKKHVGVSEHAVRKYIGQLNYKREYANINLPDADAILQNLEANNWRVPGLVGTAFPEILEGGVPEDQYEMFGSNKEHTPVRTNEECTHQVARPLGLAPVCCGQDKQVVSCLRTPAEGARDPNAQLEESDRGVLGIGNEEYLTLTSGAGYEPVPSDSNEVDEDAWQRTNVQAAHPGNAGELRRNGGQYEPISQEDKSVLFIASKELVQLEARPFALAPVHRSQDRRVMPGLKTLDEEARNLNTGLEVETWGSRIGRCSRESEQLIVALPGMLSAGQSASAQVENEGQAESLPSDSPWERTPAKANRWPWGACPGSVETLSCATHCSDTTWPERASFASCTGSNNAQAQTQRSQLENNEIGGYLPGFSLPPPDSYHSCLGPQRAARALLLSRTEATNKETKESVMQKGRDSPSLQLVEQRIVRWLAHQRTGNLGHADARSLTCHRISPKVGSIERREPIEGIAQEESRGRDQPSKEARVGTKEKGEGRVRKRDRSANVVAERKVRRREAPIRVVHSIEICSEALDTPDFALRALPDLRQASVPLASPSRLSRTLSLQVSSPEHPYHDGHDARRAPQQENARTRHDSASRQDAYPAECQNADAQSRMLTTPPEIFKTLSTGLKPPSVKPAMPVLRQSTPYPSAMPPTQCYRLTSGAVGTVRFVPPTGPPLPTTRQSTGIQGDQLVLLGHHDLNVHGPANLGRLALGGNFTVRCAPQQTHLGTQQTFVVLGCVVWYTEPGESEARPYFGDAVITFTFRGPTETVVPFVHAYEPPPPPPPSAAIQTMSTTRNERPILPLPRRPPVPQERAQQERASHDIADVWLVENAAILGNILAASPSNIPAMLNARPLVPPPLSSSGLPSPSTPLLPVTTPDSCDIENLKIPGLLYPQDSTDADVRAVSPLKTNGLRAEPVQDEDEDMPSLVDWEADAGDKTSDVEILDNDMSASDTDEECKPAHVAIERATPEPTTLDHLEVLDFVLDNIVPQDFYDAREARRGIARETKYVLQRAHHDGIREARQHEDECEGGIVDRAQKRKGFEDLLSPRKGNPFLWPNERVSLAYAREFFEEHGTWNPTNQDYDMRDMVSALRENSINGARWVNSGSRDTSPRHTDPFQPKQAMASLPHTRARSGTDLVASITDSMSLHTLYYTAMFVYDHLRKTLDENPSPWCDWLLNTFAKDFLTMQAKRRTTSALYWSPSGPSEMQRVNTLRPSMSDFEDFGYLEKAANLAMESTHMCCLIELENGETSEDVNAPLPWLYSSELEEDDEEIYAFTDFNVLGVYKRFLVYFLKMHEWNVDSQKTHCYHYQNCHLTRPTLYPERDLPETV